MPLIRLRGPLKQRAGGRAEHAVDATTVREALRALEAAQPELRGWILDERGLVRRHINVFVDGEMGREETALDSAGVVDVLPAISGGAV
jgi:molybdopterin converting factor small subunit